MDGRYRKIGNGNNSVDESLFGSGPRKISAAKKWALVSEAIRTLKKNNWRVDCWQISIISYLNESPMLIIPVQYNLDHLVVWYEQFICQDPITLWTRFRLLIVLSTFELSIFMLQTNCNHYIIHSLRGVETGLISGTAHLQKIVVTHSELERIRREASSGFASVSHSEQTFSIEPLKMGNKVAEERWTWLPPSASSEDDMKYTMFTYYQCCIYQNSAHSQATDDDSCCIVPLMIQTCHSSLLRFGI